MTINAENMHFKTLCELVKKEGRVEINNCVGQRYIGSGMEKADITIYGTPGNALGAYFSGDRITVHGNAQDATGDTMNDGDIIIHGASGDATGYAMRGGGIFVRDSAGYRAGIHMKAYQDKIPALIIGGRAGRFLGEYQAGGNIIVLGLKGEGPIVGDFCGTGMHGGAIYLRCDEAPNDLPAQVVASEADVSEIRGHIERFCRIFDFDAEPILRSRFFTLRPNKANPYKQMYTYE
ncbi:MAG: glutamate synthase [Clostridiales bacterium]|jgi:glutamate synthase domain-containing protein 3|nr:glutamate synthase [Clostridiales bacterium]